MNLHQRQEQAAPVISGRKINNYFTCTVKEVRRLSPQLYEQYGRERTFQTDSFKQILTKRSGCPANKENISTQNKALRKIKEEANSKQISQEKKKKSKSNCRRPQKKSSAVSLTKLFERNRSTNENRKVETKSVSPSRDIKDYRSGPVDKKNYLSNNNASKTNRQVLPSKSEKSLTDRVRNPLKSILTVNKKPQKNTVKVENVSKNQKKDISKVKKSKQNSKIGIKKMGNNMEKTQSIAKQLDSLLLKQTKQKEKKKKKNGSKQKQKKSKQKKVVISQNNSKNFISKNKLNSEFSQGSPDSHDKGILSTRYQNEKPAKRQRLSFQPYKKKGKSRQKAKTEALSPQKSLANKKEAAIMIQKVFRGYLTRKYIKQFKRTLLAVLTIQKMWRGYKARKQVNKMKQKTKILNKENLKLSKFSEISQGSRPAITPRNNQLASLLEEILNEENLNEKIKVKISSFLKKQERSVSSKNHSATSHMQQEMKSEKRFFEKIDKQKHKFGSPMVRYSPKIQKSDLRKSPEVMIQSLLTIQQFQREKLITNAKMQIEGLQSLTIKNIFSPRTRDNKKFQIHKKLQEDLQKFDQSITEVIKSCKQNQEIVGPIKPFSGSLTPEKAFAEINVNLFDNKNRYENSPTMKQQKKEIESMQNMNSSQRKLQDLSMQLLQYYEQKTQQKGQKQYERIDCSYIFIQQYLLSLFQYLRQLGQEYRQGFIDIMRTNRNLEISCFLKNLNVLTEDSDEDISFKLPMYKYLQQQQNQVLSRRVVQQFNNSHKKLQRHQFGIKSNLEDVYLKMILDAVNEALNIERPNSYIFTQAALVGKTNKMRILQLEALEGIDGDDNQPQFSFYFANSMNHIYKWAHFQCGRAITDDNMEEVPIMEINQASLKQYLKFEALKQQNYYDELLETIVELSDCIFDQIILQQGANLYL